jgi:hypothetical protein
VKIVFVLHPFELQEVEVELEVDWPVKILADKNNHGNKLEKEAN